MSPVRRVADEVMGVVQKRTSTHAHLNERLVATFWVTIAVDVVATVLVFFTERGGKGTEIDSIGSAAFWVSAQLLTISSQMKNPVTSAGRVIDIFLELYAIVVVTSMAGMFASFFHRRSHERAEAERQASSD